MAPSSATLPGLERKPGKQNWIEMLPAPMRAAWHRSIIYRAAKHMAAKGMPVGMAIASAKNWAQHICDTGDVKQWRGPQQVAPTSKAECCAAVTLWGAMRAAAKTDTSIPARERKSIELAMREIDRQERVIELANRRLDEAAIELARRPGVMRQLVVDLAGPRSDVKRLLHALGFKGSLSNALSAYASHRASRASASSPSTPSSGSRHRGGSKKGEHRGGAKKGVPHMGARGKPHPHAGAGKGRKKGDSAGASSPSSSAGSSGGGGVKSALANLGYSGSTPQMLEQLRRDLAKRVKRRNLT